MSITNTQWLLIKGDYASYKAVICVGIKKTCSGTQGMEFALLSKREVLGVHFLENECQVTYIGI